MEKITEITRLKEVIDQHQHIVFLGGAGTSTESGVKDFRSPDGLYSIEHDYNPEHILSHKFFYHLPKIFYEFFREHIININPLPNGGHRYLTKLEASGKLQGIITQNIDGLHQASGSQHVLELHGTVHSNHCVKCHKFFDLNYIKTAPLPVRCDACNGLVKPDVVLYGEPLDEMVISEAVKWIENSDLLIVAGTSLNVYPAAGLLRYAKKTLLLNLARTSKDIYCDYVYYGKFAETLEKLDSRID